MKTIKVILIDPYEQKLELMQIESSLASYYKVLGVDMIEAAYPIKPKKGEFLYLDEEGLYKEPLCGFHLEGYPQPYMGKGIMLGSSPDGEDMDCPLGIEDLNITWRPNLSLVKHI
jgi:hypothetical protein